MNNLIDLESFRIFDIYIKKRWFNSIVILLYYCNNNFSIEVVKRTWFSCQTDQYNNLSWLQAIKLFDELKENRTK